MFYFKLFTLRSAGQLTLICRTLNFMYFTKKNPQIREHPKYHLLKSRTSLHAGNEHEAITTLKMAMNLPGVRTRHEKAPVEGGDRLDIFLLLVHALLKNEQIVGDSLWKNILKLHLLQTSWCWCNLLWFSKLLYALSSTFVILSY